MKPDSIQAIRGGIVTLACACVLATVPASAAAESQPTATDSLALRTSTEAAEDGWVVEDPLPEREPPEPRTATEIRNRQALAGLSHTIEVDVRIPTQSGESMAVVNVTIASRDTGLIRAHAILCSGRRLLWVPVGENRVARRAECRFVIERTVAKGSQLELVVWNPGQELPRLYRLWLGEFIGSR